MSETPALNKKNTAYVGAPEVFDLSRYDALEHIQNRHFAGMLEYRRQIWFGVIHAPDGTPKPLDGDELGQIINRVDDLLMHPMKFAASVPLLKGKDRIYGPLVSEPSVIELEKYTEAFREYLREASIRRPDIVYKKDGTEDPYLGAIAANHMRSVFPDRFKRPELLMKINLDARDDELIRSFGAFLRDARPIRHAPTPSEFESETTAGTKKKIIQHRSIPYIDLMIWSKLRGVKIKTSLIADTLFPRSHYDATTGSRHIRDTTDKYADKALANAFVQSLWS